MAKYLEVAVPAPLFATFDYLVPDNLHNQPCQPGTRVLVPFARRKLIGIIVNSKTSSDVADCKAVIEFLEPTPSITTDIFALCEWAANYYHYPLGQVFTCALPKKLRQDKAIKTAHDILYQLTDSGKKISLSELKRAPKQANAIALFKQHRDGIKHSALKSLAISSATIKALFAKDWLSQQTIAIDQTINERPATPLSLNDEQQQALHVVTQANGFSVFLLHGITGSGKTEVYLQSIQQVLDKQQQVLMLIPEISLTPQTLGRFRERFREPVYALHSGMNDSERYAVWLKAKTGEAQIIIGTRSAIFTPFANLGLIIIDEEHDSSYKQHDTLRYHARDLSVVRAKQRNIPLLLGSATPSIESYYNCIQKKFSELILSQRAADAKPPLLKVIDCRNKQLQHGLSEPLIALIKKHLQQNHQVLVFLNRRGYAPVLMCHDCGYTAKCKRCDTHMTLHLQQHQLRCHHCQAITKQPTHCPECHSDNLLAVGKGTQRLESALHDIFPDINCARIDRDSTRHKDALAKTLQQIENNEIQLLIGTQMLAKGHHFPDVTLVAIVDIDGSLFSSDFRATEKLAQLITQVAGRAGRGSKAGEVALQTHHPDHPLLHKILQQDYHEVLRALLAERQMTDLPPFSYLALYKAEANSMEKCIRFLNTVKAMIGDQLDCFGPTPAILAKKAGKYRAELLCQANKRSQLHAVLKHIQPKISNHDSSKSVRWILDIDPGE